LHTVSPSDYPNFNIITLTRDYLSDLQQHLPILPFVESPNPADNLFFVW
jgi:hypothetical protein